MLHAAVGDLQKHPRRGETEDKAMCFIHHEGVIKAMIIVHARYLPEEK